MDYMDQVTISELCPEKASERRENVAYAEAVHKTYHSNTCGLDRGVNILLPVDYTEEKKYPVLYLLHGIFWDEYTMLKDEKNRIPELAANLAADQAAKEMIIVFPNMFAATDENQKPGFTAEGTAPYDNFINDLVNDLMPYIESNYSVLTGRDHTALAGFSMGGRETLFIGLNRPDLFGYIGAISPAPGLVPSKDWAMEHQGQMSEQDVCFKDEANLPYLFMVCCGTQDSVVGTYPASYHKILEANHVKHIWYEVPGADHNDEAIRSGLHNFMSAIFRK